MWKKLHLKDILLNHSSMKDYLLNYKLRRNKYNSILSQLWSTKFLSLDIIQLTELQVLILHLKEKYLRIRGHEEVYLPWIFVGSGFCSFCSARWFWKEFNSITIYMQKVNMRFIFNFILLISSLMFSMTPMGCLTLPSLYF